MGDALRSVNSLNWVPRAKPKPPSPLKVGHRDPLQLGPIFSLLDPGTLQDPSLTSIPTAPHLAVSWSLAWPSVPEPG